jgi:sulfate-transporting ATPase
LRFDSVNSEPVYLPALMAGEYIFTMRDLRKVVPPSKEILKGIYLAFYPGAKIGVLGPNGAGKSTLLRIMAGVDTDYLGEARPLPGTRIGYLPQEPRLDPAKDVRGNVEIGVAEPRALLTQFEELSARFAEPMDDDEMTRLLERQGNLQERIDALGLWELDHKIDLAMDALRLPPGDADVSTISGGERRRVALCQVLLAQPDMLLLDEPTNHLDAESVWWLERYLAEFSGTVVAVTHDRYRGWRRSNSDWPTRRSRHRPGKRLSSTSSSGSAWRLARGRPRARRVSPATRNCAPKRNASPRVMRKS